MAEGKTPSTSPKRDKPTILSKKWKIGGGLKERDQLDVWKVLSKNTDRFAYAIEELVLYTGPPMEIN